jgi:hypothetical protein
MQIGTASRLAAAAHALVQLPDRIP